jgi:hypothetical protein
MANVLSIPGSDFNAVRLYEREKLIRYNCALSGSYVQHIRGTNTGELLDLTKTITGNFLPQQYWGLTGPLKGYVLNTGGTGFGMSIVPGADGLHWLLCIFSGVAAELAAGTYAANAAGLLTDLDITIEFSGRSFA